VGGTTTARPFESNAIELERRGVRFLVRIITKMCEAITSRMPVGYEDETGFHYGVAEARLIPIRTGRIPNRSPRETCLKARRVAMRVPNFDSADSRFLNGMLHPYILSGCRPNPKSRVRYYTPDSDLCGGGTGGSSGPYRDQLLKGNF
jgi:hypothetical protein